MQIRGLKVICLCAVLVAATSCGREEFRIKLPEDAGLKAQTEAALPLVLKRCPGLEKYAGDFTEATVERNDLKPGYQGGITIRFRISENPKHLPDPLSPVASGHVCLVDVKKDNSMMTIYKSACYSICEGRWDSPEPPDKEFSL